MANNVSIKDAAAATVVQKTTDNAGVHTPHQNIDSLPTLATVTTVGTVTTLTGGGIADDGADSGNPVKVGGRASSSLANAANNDRVDFITTLDRRQVVALNTNPENCVSGAITTAMTGTADSTLLAAAGSGLRNYITTLIVSNAHATVGTDVVIKEGSTVLLTIPAAAVYGGAALTMPVPLRQPTANTAIVAANLTTGSSTKVSAVGFKAP